MTVGRIDLKQRLADSIRSDATRLAALGQDIFTHPELAYREHRTANLVAGQLRELGLTVEEGLAITGARAEIRGVNPGPTIAVIGELDGLRVPDHPAADPDTGAAHACGHNAQLVHLLAIARSFCALDIAAHLAGRIVFFAVPAEEFADIEWGLEQIKAGRIEFLGGKQELLRLGLFEGIDAAMLTHAVGRDEQTPLSVSWRYNGFIPKKVRFIGRASHAAASPHLGVNALNAASLALQAVHCQRETFQDEDHVRIHAVLTGGGGAINVVPADVGLEAFVRAATVDAMTSANDRFDRAMRGAAMAIGSGAQIDTLAGYLPLDVNRDLGTVFRDNAIALTGTGCWSEIPSVAASTDAGDLSQVIPFLHPSHGGCRGSNHSATFEIVDTDQAYVLPSIAMAWTLLDLLADDASAARHVLTNFRPAMTRDEYLQRIRGISGHERVPIAD